MDGGESLAGGGAADGDDAAAGAGGADIITDACSKLAWTATASVECVPPGLQCPGWWSLGTEAGLQQGPAQAIDGDWNTRYTTGRAQDGTEEVVLSFPAPVQLSGLRITAPYISDMLVAYELEYSLDGLTFHPFEPPIAGMGADSSSDLVPSPLPRQPGAVALPLVFSPTEMTSIKIKQTGRGAGWWSILELDPLDCSPL